MSDLAFAVFVDRVSAAFAESMTYRRRLLAEAPGHIGRGPRVVCPPEHPHGSTSHCYNAHRCGCTDCREASAERQRASRMQRAKDQWNNARRTHA